MNTIIQSVVSLTLVISRVESKQFFVPNWNEGSERAWLLPGSTFCFHRIQNNISHEKKLLIY